MRFGIVGADVIGTIHARIIASIAREEAELVAVADTNQAAAKQLADAYDCLALSTVDDLVARPVRLTVAGDAGTAVVADERLAYLRTRDTETGESDGSVGTADTMLEASALGDIDDAHRAQYLDFLAAVRDHRPPRVTTSDGRRALALVLASYESARNSGRPVSVR